MKRFLKRHALKVPLSLFVIFQSLVGFSAKHFVNSAENNSSESSINSPWPSLPYACAKVTNPRNNIHINAGTCYESSRAGLPIGLSIDGADIEETVIESSYVAVSSSDGSIHLTFSSSTDGNQSMSYFPY